MGCRNLSYYEAGEALGENHFFLGEGLEKRETEQNFCNSYYPFGLRHDNSWERPGRENRNKFNAASEQNEQTGNYEMFFRAYDPAIGRMTGIDPYAELYRSLSPYNYANNDPVYFNDPSGGTIAFFDPVQDREEKLNAQGIPTSFGYSGGNTSSMGGGSYGSSGIASNVINFNRFGGTVDPETGEETAFNSLEESEKAKNNYTEGHGMKWNPVGGKEITKEEWIALGNNPDKIDPNKTYKFYTGAWEQGKLDSEELRRMIAEIIANDIQPTSDMTPYERFMFVLTKDHQIEKRFRVLQKMVLDDSESTSFQVSLYKTDALLYIIDYPFKGTGILFEALEAFFQPSDIEMDIMTDDDKSVKEKAVESTLYDIQNSGGGGGTSKKKKR